MIDLLGIVASLFDLLFHLAKYMSNAVWAWQQTALNHRSDVLMDALDADTPRLWSSTQRRMRIWNFLHNFRGR